MGQLRLSTMDMAAIVLAEAAAFDMLGKKLAELQGIRPVGLEAAKAAIIGITRHLAKKVAADGITVNAVAPGTIESDMLKDFTQADLEAIYKTIPMGRLGKPEEIAETIAFLASDAAAFMTGAILDVNGGNYMA